MAGAKETAMSGPERRHPVIAVDRELAQRLLSALDDRLRVTDCAWLSGGYCNSNYRLELDGPPARAVLRICTQDAARYRAQVDIQAHIRGGVPVPHVLYASDATEHMAWPHYVMSWVDGERLDMLLPTLDENELHQAGQSVGHVLAMMGHHTFERSGLLGPGMTVVHPHGSVADGVLNYVRKTLMEGRAATRVDPTLRQRVWDMLTAHAHELDALDQTPRLVHEDFNGKNILMRNRTEVAAVLDWDFAIAGSPIADFGNLFREPMPSRFEDGVLDGYARGGMHLPADWRRAARLIEVTGICECLNLEIERPRLFQRVIAMLHATLDFIS